jgi:rhodanese-related sulfurtransferase
MILKLFLTTLLSLCSFNSFATELSALTPDQLEKLQQQNNPLVIDIRTLTEWQQTGLIPNSHPLQFFDEHGRADQQKWLAELKKLQKNSDQAIVLVCRSGNRSTKVGKILTEVLGLKNIYHLSKGIQHWLALNHNLVAYCDADNAC